jgi:tetratricopeptide (TPR) repeat protein
MKKNNTNRFLVSFVLTCLTSAGSLAVQWTPVRAGATAARGSDAADVPPIVVGHPATKPIDTIDDVPYRARLAMTRAQDEYDQGNLEAAIKELREFVTRHADNDHFILRGQLGNLLVQAGKQEEAMTEYKTAVSLERRFTQGWLNLGEIAYNLGQYEVAADALRNGYEQSEHKQANLLYYCAAAYIMAKKPASATPLLEELVGGLFGQPKLEWFRALIAAYSDLKDTDRGRKATESLLRIYGDNADAWYLAFQFYAGSGDFEQAAVALKVADYIKPLTRQQTTQLGDVFATIKVPVMASSCYQRVLDDSSGSPRDYEKLASTYLASYELDAASRAITDGLKKEPTYRLWSLLGDTRFIQLDYPAAFDAYRECSKLDSTQGRPYLMMGFCALQSDRAEEAIPYLERASEFPDQRRTAEQLLARARPRTAANEDPIPQESAESVTQARDD